MLLLLMIFLPMAAAPVGWMIGRRSKRGRDALAIGVGFVELALALAAYFLRSSAGADLTAELGGICGLGLRLKYDGFRAVYCLVLSFMWAMTLLFSPDYFAHHHNRNRYYFFQLLTLGATMGVFLSADLYTAFVFFEIMSFTSFPWVIQEETARMPQTPDLVSAPERRAEAGAGATGWAFGSQIWRGNMPAFAPKPKRMQAAAV